MQRRLVVDCYFLTGTDVTQRNEQNVIPQDLHERIRLARVIDVMSAIPTTTTIQTPAIVDGADA